MNKKFVLLLNHENSENIRKKESDYSAIEDNSSVNIAKKQKTSTGGFLATSKKDSEKEDLTYKSSGSVNILFFKIINNWIEFKYGC